MKRFKISETRKYNDFQKPIIIRYCRRFHLSVMDYVTKQAKHFDIKHHEG